MLSSQRRILSTVKTKSYFLLLLLMAMGLPGCSITSTQGERRVIELPRNDPNATLATAQQICADLIANGFAADIQREFPDLTPAQMQGLFLSPNEGTFQNGPSVFILTGISYTGSLPEAKAIADYCESAVRKAVAARFPAAVLPPAK